MHEPRPNVVLLVADDHQSTAMNWAGCSEVHTPNLDRLARMGTAFKRAYHMGGCDDAVCVPTRASLLTGMDIYGSMRGERGTIDPDRVTLPEYFRQQGYYSYATGKWHNDRASLARSFDDGDALFIGGMFDHYATPIRPFDPNGVFPDSDIKVCQQFATDSFCNTACSFIEAYDRDHPFFLYTAFTAPHDPRSPPTEHAARYHSESIPVPENFSAEHSFDLGVRDIRDECLAPYPRTPARIKKELKNYYGMITAMDAGIGRIINVLESSGQLKNTIILYTGDHGLALGQHGLLGKQNVYEHSARVPFIIAGPSIPADQKTESLIYSWDSFASLCDLCGVAIPEHINSKSFSKTLDSPQIPHRENIVNLYMQNQRMVVDGRWKLTAIYTKETIRFQLFDLSNDPNEIRDQSANPDCKRQFQHLYNILRNSPAGLPNK